MADRESRKRQITGRRHAQILKAATEVFAQKGYAAATIPEIAGMAGLAPGTIYLYYASKRDLFVAAIEQLMMAPLVRVFDRESRGGFLGALGDAIEDRLELLQSEAFPRLISLMGEIQRDEELRTMFFGKLLGPFIARMEGMYRARIAAGEFRSMEPEMVVRLVGSTIIGMSLLKVMEGEASPMNHMPKDRIAAEIKDFVLYGLMGGEGVKQENRQ